MKLLAKGINASWDVFKTVKHLRWDFFKAVNFFRKNLHLRYSAGSWKCLSGFTVFNYFNQKLHLTSLRGLICLYIYLVWQFWRWINKISKVCYEETFPWNCFFKQSSRLPGTYWECSSGKFMKFSEQFSEKTPAMAASAISCHWKMFRPKHIFQKISHSFYNYYYYYYIKYRWNEYHNNLKYQ